jgi:hypothetical protein
VLSKRVERLPADRIEAKAAIEAAIRKSIASEQDAYRQGEQARQNARQQHIELRRKSTVAGDLSVRGKRCDTLLAVEKTGAGEFTSTCLVKGKQKQYKSYFSGLD